MMHIIITLLLNALLIVGLHVATYHGNILGFLRDPSEYDEGLGFSRNGTIKKPHWNTLPDWLKKPLYDCPTCMASVHSTYFYWYFVPFSGTTLLEYPFYIVCLSGLATYIYRQIE